MNDQPADVLIAAEARAGAPEGAPRLSGEFIRQALLSKVEIPADCPLTVDDRGARLEGAIIEGELDLSAAGFDRPIIFERCTFAQPIVLTRAKLDHLSILKSRAPGLLAQFAEFHGGLDLRGTWLDSPDSIALNGEGIRVGNSVWLSDGFVSTGTVVLRDSQINHALFCMGGKIQIKHPLAATRSTEGPTRIEGLAIYALGAAIGYVLLTACQISGLAGFVSASVRGNFGVIGSSLTSGGLLLTHTEIGGSLIFARVEAFEGLLDLTGVNAKGLVEDGSIWADSKTGKPRPGVRMYLEDLRYADFVSVEFALMDMDWRKRLAWLKAQPAELLSAEFVSQPFTQCASVLREKGDAHGAKMILFEREQLRLKAKHVGFWEKAGGHILGVLAGHGYKTERALYWAIGVWILGGLIFGVADYLGEMRPADPHILVEHEYQETLRPPTDYEPVNPLLYSADILLPVVELGQQEYWIPRNAGEHIADVDHAFPNLARGLRDTIAWLFSGWLPKAYYYFEIFMGWLLVSIVIAGFSGLLGHAKEE
ncbi:MAG: hypothetical protein WAW96_06285 [Alphaproteobacteria bacterium]